MNIKRKIKILTISLLGICIGSTISNAAIEVKPGTTSHIKITPSTAYEYCYNMRAYSSSLGANSLDPHLTLHADWAAAAYLAFSGYGYASMANNANGYTVTIDGKSYYSTTKNATGVMNMGKTVTYTSSLKGESGSTNLTNLMNYKNTKYVEKLATSSEGVLANKAGLAIWETKSWLNSVAEYPGDACYQIARVRLIGYGGTAGSWWYEGRADSGATYRPVIWN